MAGKMRWRYGDTNPVVAAVDSGTQIEIGDLVYQDIDDAKPASMLGIYDPAQNTPEVNMDLMKVVHKEFANNFLGVAMQRSRAGDTNLIRVATTGVFEFDCPSGTFELGDLLGADENAGGDALLDQQVASVSTSKYAIGRVAKRVAAAATSVLVDVRSKVRGQSI